MSAHFGPRHFGSTHFAPVHFGAVAPIGPVLPDAIQDRFGGFAPPPRHGTQPWSQPLPGEQPPHIEPDLAYDEEEELLLAAALAIIVEMY